MSHVRTHRQDISCCPSQELTPKEIKRPSCSTPRLVWSAWLLIAHLLVCNVGICWAQHTFAQTNVDDGWHADLSPYLWFAGAHGTAGTFGPDLGIHASAGDLPSHFNMGLMSVAEAQHKRFVLNGNLQVATRAIDHSASGETYNGLGTTMSLTVSDDNAAVGSPVTFTATISCSAGIPIGSVEFYDGTDTIGSAPLSESGVASLTVTSFEVGTHSVIAIYTGNFRTSTSSAVTVTILDPSAPAITFVGEAVGTLPHIGPGPIAVTPPPNMLPGDLVVMFAQNRQNSTTLVTCIGNLRVSETGGQGWSMPQEVTDGPVDSSTAYVGRVFYSTFNGTWSAKPSLTMTNGDTTPFTVVMWVFRPTSPSKYWVPDVGPVYNNPSAATTVSISGITTVAASTVTIAVWGDGSNTTWGTLTGSGWSKSGLSAQYRNSSGRGQSLTMAYNIRTTPGAVACVSQRQARSTESGTLIFSLAEVDLPSGGGNGLTGGLQMAAHQDADGDTSETVTFNSAVVPGNAIICYGHYESNVRSYVTGITDNAFGATNSYYILARVSDSQLTQDGFLFFSPNVQGSGLTQVTFNLSDVETDRGVVCVEADDVSSFDAINTPTTTDHRAVDATLPATISTLPAISPSQANSFLFAGVSTTGGTIGSGPLIPAAADGWTPDPDVCDAAGITTCEDDSDVPLMGAWQVASSPWTKPFVWTNTLDDNTLGIMGIFDPGASPNCLINIFTNTQVCVPTAVRANSTGGK